VPAIASGVTGVRTDGSWYGRRLSGVGPAIRLEARLVDGGARPWRTPDLVAHEKHRDANGEHRARTRPSTSVAEPSFFETRFKRGKRMLRITGKRLESYLNSHTL